MFADTSEDVSEVIAHVFLLCFLTIINNLKQTIMKKAFRFLGMALLAVLNLGITACSDDEVTPELNVPTGNENYFTKSMDFSPSASEKTFTFSSNVSWTLSVADTRSGSNWLTATPTSGESGIHTITVRALENTTYDDRNAVITISAGDSIRKVFVNQKQLDALTLTSNRFEVPVEGGSVSIEVKSNISYSIIIPEEYKGWIHQSNGNTRGLSASTLSFTIDKCEEYNKREGKIIVKADNKEELITIYQAGEGILSLTQNEYNISSSAQELNIEINSNFDYDVEMPNVDWIHETTAQTRGISTHTLRLAIQENESYDGRSAKIRIYDKNSSISEEIVINQSQKNALIIDKKEFVFDENGGSFSVGINSNVNYKVSINGNWITESTANTRSLVATSHSFVVSAISANSDREGTITFSDTKTGISEKVIVKQNRTIYFDNNTLTLMEGSEKTINLTNKSGQTITWSSSNPSIASVDNTGKIKALLKGNTTISATTKDEQHTCKIEIIVCDITDYVTARSLGGSIVSINGLIRYGSVLNWQFSNKSTENVYLKTMQLIDGETGNPGNQMPVGVDVPANSSVSYSTTIGLFGIYAPVTCRFRFDYNNKEYYVDAVYTNNW